MIYPPPEWLQEVTSDITEDFLKPLNPKEGEDLTIRIRTPRRARLKKVLLHIRLNGEYWSKPMTKSPQGKVFDWWEFTLKVQEPRLRWSFILDTEKEGFWFLNRSGTARHHLTSDHDFVVIAGAEFPLWISQGAVYQIFPDRFHRGRRSGGVKAGDWEQDGLNPIPMRWNQKPLSWSQGKCLDFFNGDLEGVRLKIPYLKELGVTTIFLNPIFEARSTHRYDCIDYFHVASALGGDRALARLTQDLHQAGMKIILDISINHTGIRHPWAVKAAGEPESKEAGFYYTDKGKLACWLGVPELPMLNYNSKDLKKIMYLGPKSVLKKWISPPFSIDGWRFDVGNYTGRLDRDQLGHGIFNEIRRELKKENPEVYLTGEHWQDSIGYLQGDQWDGSMNYFGCARALRSFAGLRDRYIYGEDPQPEMVPGELTGEDLGHQILQHFSRMPHLIPHMQLNILDSHDLFRLHNHAGAFHWPLYRALVGIQYLLPGTPNLYYGDEVGLEGWTENMEGVRFPMEWNEKKWKQSFVEFYRSLNKLKAESKVLHLGGLKLLYADENALVLARFLGNEAVLAAISRSRSPISIRVPVGTLGLVSASEFLTGQKAIVHEGHWTLNLEPRHGGIWTGVTED